MIKLGNYLILLMGMMMFLEFLVIATGVSVILNTFNVQINPVDSTLIIADLENSGFFSQIFTSGGVLLSVIGGLTVVAIGLFARGYDPSLVILPAVVFVGTLFASTFWLMINYAMTFNQPWLTALVATIFIPLGIGFIWSNVDYFAGR